MSRSNFGITLFRLVSMLAIITSATVFVSAQTVEFDWNSTNKSPESFPQIRRKQLVTFRIRNVNDILYTYRLEVTQTPMEVDDFALISKLLFPAPANAANKAPNRCSDAVDKANAKLQAAADEISGDPKLPVGYEKSPTHGSIPLSDSVAAWRTHDKAIMEVGVAVENALKQCSGDPGSELINAYTAFRKSVLAIENKVNSTHIFLGTSELSPGNNVSATVFEMFKTQTISSKTFSFPGTDILTLSAGALFTTIPDRSYQARKTPDSTQNVLAVEGNSRYTPGVVALLNYSLGALHLDGETTGLALSAGPVVRFGTQSNSSAVGFFTGISGHLYHRIYFTPGIHFGQFADFPVGFRNGSSIPANFGELTPVKRWTGRFGFAITFKTKDFSSLGQSNTASVKSGDSSTTPKPATTPTTTSTSLPPISRRIATKAVTATDSLPEEGTAKATGSAVQRDLVAIAASLTDISGSVVHITSLESVEISGKDRLLINAAAPLRDYAMYFKNGRFYVVIPHGRLDSIEDGLCGRLFSEALVEKHADNLILSFVLQRGARISLADRANGLGLLIASSRNDGGTGVSASALIGP